MAKEAVEVPMTGKIISVNVKVGDNVAEDDILFVLESMKMENPIVAPVKGTVVEMRVKPDETAEAGKVAVVIETG